MLMRKISFQPAHALLAVGFFAGTFGLRADVKMPTIFGDHMVLQQEAKLPVWGWADPGEKVTVTLAAQSASAVADAQGNWRVDLPPVSAGTAPTTLKIAGKNVVQFQDVLVGDVWLCTGGANMQVGLLNDQNGKTEAAQADQPQIRLFAVPLHPNMTPQKDILRGTKWDDLTARWQICTPATVVRDGEWGGFSALAYYYGKQIHQVTGHPVGLIGTYWSGTAAQAWTSLEALQKYPVLAHFVTSYQNKAAALAQPDAKYKDLVEEYHAAQAQWKLEVAGPYRAAMAQWELRASEARSIGQEPPKKPEPLQPEPAHPEWMPTVLFNAMIAPLVPFAIKGAICYQGEANEWDAAEYGTLFPAMITDWRERWGQGDFPFLFVQLAKYRQPAVKASEGAFPWVRESQARALSLPNTGMAVALDLGSPKEIVPKDKSDVAARLVLVAKHVAYGQTLVYSGPMFDSMRGEGEQIRINFKETGGGLTTGTPPWTWDGNPVPPPTELTGFALAGVDKKWFWARAVIHGDSIIVTSDQVPAPVAVRYGWADNPPANLYNKEMLPAVPFRTDDWRN